MIPGGGDLQGLLEQAQAMQAQMMQAQSELAETMVEGTSGGDLVKATLSGSGELVGLEIAKEACDPDDTEALADLIIAAVRDANGKVQNLASQKLGPMASGLGGLSF